MPFLFLCSVEEEIISEQKKIFNSFFIPALFVVMMWVVKLTELFTKSDFSSFGLTTGEFQGLKGIITCLLYTSDAADE